MTKEEIIKIIKGYECDKWFGAEINGLPESEYEDVANDILEALNKPLEENQLDDTNVVESGEVESICKCGANDYTPLEKKYGCYECGKMPHGNERAKF